MSKIYTGTGDQGMTSLADGSRVSKADPRVAAYGKTDELISWIGLLRSQSDSLTAFPSCKHYESSLRKIQTDLMYLAGHLAYGNRKSVTDYDFEGSALFLERTIDKLQEQIPVLQSFILPYTPPLASQIHIVRTVCRDAERLMVSLGTDIVTAPMLKYINRLSDYLFVLARFITVRTGCEEDFFI
ncbi:MAG: cob(I)yrinic acid a,c-diamide adenosyltransferase [Bacteroidales bacterium]|jgi:cob(I)alamin adenosyltransferase|nr:cob(I)yrinic acid a,c-diamide adenosyltransferase [Bacteroidales bacterium]MDD2770612.1 cob(I)yrinic acid a,c-diamide adenosyltransferase [Bacteroidales bacterium]MDD3104648.1 cob(I)yrinic acid a,c-diamide adenosyltransferase [Bacteroidales bacterium]MDD3549361.1 cob(I)yrinic acid a,c-diamide adenosyltransferase [Bacteroidales bacterium]MDD4064398.1 cob(I)yrinic acid a,c-diamide adenosyltransferase [Bacteroidales bacterium]